MSEKKRPDYLRLAWSDGGARDRRLVSLACGPDNMALARAVQDLQRRGELRLCPDVSRAPSAAAHEDDPTKERP